MKQMMAMVLTLITIFCGPNSSQAVQNGSIHSKVIKSAAALPSAVLLPIPDRDQDSDAPPEGWCGETSIQMGLRYYHKMVSQKAIHAAGHPGNHELYRTNIPIALDELNVEYVPWDRSNSDLSQFMVWIKTNLAQGYPVLCGVKCYPTRFPEWTVDHFVIVAGYNDKGFYMNTNNGRDGQILVSYSNLSSFTNRYSFESIYHLYFGIALMGIKNATMELAVGADPQGVNIGDLNGDGRRDLVVCNSGDNTIAVLLNKGNQTFAIPAYYQVDDYPVAIAIGDLNGDHYPDLVVANKNSDTVSVLLNNGDGTYQKATSYPVGTTPCSVAIGDFDQDGQSDLVATVNLTDNSVSVLWFDQNGTFLQKDDYNVNGSHPCFLAIGDLNNDTYPDIVTANNLSQDVFVLPGYSNRTYASGVTYAVGNGPGSIILGDLNHDGHPDLAVTNAIDNTVAVLFNNGSGAFLISNSYALGPNASYNPYAVVMGDLNGDGHPDLATVNLGTNSISMVLNDGNGTFSHANVFTLPDNAQPSSIAIGDLDGDGYPDLAVANSGTSNVSLFFTHLNGDDMNGQTGGGGGGGGGCFITTLVSGMHFKKLMIGLCLGLAAILLIWRRSSILQLQGRAKLGGKHRGRP